MQAPIWRINLVLFGRLALSVGWYLMAEMSVYGQAADSITYYRKTLAIRHKPGVSAHRGSSEIAPENTLATFRAVLPMQVNYIEIDVRTTKDGQLVILHDATLHRTTNGIGPVKDQTLAELKKLSAAKGFDERFASEQVPTVEEVCQLLAEWNAHHTEKTHLYVDCRDIAAVPLVAILSKYGLLTDAIFYSSDENLLILQKVAPTAKRMPGLNNADLMADKISKLHPYAFYVSWSALTESLVEQIHQQGITVFSDLLDNHDVPDHYVKAAQLGIDVIQTDHVLRVYRTLARQRDK